MLSVKRRPLLCAVALLLASGGAHAENRELTRCMDAYEQAQVLRDDRKLADARGALLVCARDVCPAMLRRDCAKWLDEVERDMGSVVFRAVDARGVDIPIEAAAIDGNPVGAGADGWAVTVEPGRHVVRVSVSGHPPNEQTVVVGQGEKNRIVLFRIEDSAPANSPPPPPPPEPEPKPGVPVAAFVAGGVALAALGTFAYAGITGWSDLETLHDECGARRLCTQSDVDDVKTKLLVADVAALVGVIALGVATYFLVDHATSRRAARLVRSGGVAF